MTQNAVVLRKFLDAENARDLDSMATCLCDDFALHVASSGEVYKGRMVFLNLMRKIFESLKDWDLGVVRTIEDENAIAVEFEGAGHFSGEMAGQHYCDVPINLKSICVFDFENGRIKKCTEYFDSQAFLKQLTMAEKPKNAVP